MNNILLSGLCVTSLLLGSTAAAQQGSTGPAIGVKAGTTGFGGEFIAPLSDALNLRIGYSRLDYERDFDTDDVRYDGDITRNAASLVADWHPGSAAFRVSGGLYHHFDNEIDVTGRPGRTGSYEFNNRIYSSDDIGSIRGSGRFNKTTPYIGIGWGNATRGSAGVGFMAELGLMYQGSASVRLSARDCRLPEALCTQLAEDLREEARELEDDINDYKWWPVLNLGIYLRF